MLNEAKYRSPKWLRNFIDYEVNTGEDIKGEPSKKRAEKLEKKRIAELEIQRELRQREKDKAEFIRRDQQAREDIRKRRERQEQIEREINTLYLSMISDFTNARYSDKIRTPTVNGETAFHYTFENGKIIKIQGNSIHWNNIVYTIGTITKTKFIKLANEMIRKKTTRPSNQSNTNTNRTNYTKTDVHPRGNLYNTLKLTIKQREEQLSKLSKNDPSRTALENELENAKNKVKEMKIKYQFENLKSFDEFNK
jgi:hypothetical protein